MTLRRSSRISTILATCAGLGAVAFVLAACGVNGNPNMPPGFADAAPPDSLPGILCDDPNGDDDGDCISNTLEGCFEGRDTDNDGFVDAHDPDSDGDFIQDRVEVGSCSNPTDTDRDGIPDYQDHDSDNDGVSDGDEDRNHDGMVGTCSGQCATNNDCPGAKTCSISVHPDEPGLCVDFDCLGGETNPHSTDTDADGVPDGLEGNFICNEASEDNPNGVRRIVYADSADTSYVGANWRVALGLGTFEGHPDIMTPGPLESAYTFDMPSSSIQVAGFLVTRPSDPLALNAVAASERAIPTILATPQIASVTTRVSGTNTISLDGFETVVSTTFELNTVGLITVTDVREALVPALLGRNPAQVVMPPPGWVAATDTEFILIMQTVFRSMDQQTLYQGAVARRSDYDNRTRATGIAADDLANGTGHSVSQNGEAIECQQFRADKQATADIIWIADESGSMSDDRQRVADAATAFFQTAISSGLDFRMGVTDMNNTGPGNQPGIFASRQAGGTGDRWLTPTEATVFAASMNDPSGPDIADGGAEHGLTQGAAAINRHMPRDNSDPQMVRENAKLVVIYVTDEKPDELEDLGLLGFGNVEPTLAQSQAIFDYLNSAHLPLFIDSNAVAHLIAEPPPFDASACSGGGEHAYGYYELVNATGGQIGSICQDNLQPTIDAIIDSIIAEASPIVLGKFPISASISVARDNVAVARSRDTGWDYRGAANSIVFFNMPFEPANPSDIVVSYRRWADQIPVE